MHMVTLASYALNRPSSHQERIVNDVFSSIERLVSCILGNEYSRNMLRDLLYNSQYPTSISQMVKILTRNIAKEKTESKERDVRYHIFLEVNRRFSQHVRIIAERVDVNSFEVIWEITQSNPIYCGELFIVH